MTNVVIRHISGTRSNQQEQFELTDDLVLAFGRDPSSDIAYDPDGDDLVSRHHAQIARTGEQSFGLTDLDSRNGTFVNGARVQKEVKLEVGDTVRFGENGPEFQFDLDPRPDWAVPKTRLGTPVAETRMAEAVPPASEPLAAKDAGNGIGRATVERMVSESSRGSRTNMAAIAVAVLAVVAIVGAVTIWRTDESASQLQADLEDTQRGLDQVAAVQAAAPMTPRDIASSYSESTVYVEVAWKLVDIGTGRQLYHLYHSKPETEEEKKARGDKPIEKRPAYFWANGKVVPWLTYTPDGNVPIGSAGTGSGFVVSENGFIMTNRHVSAPWQSPYSFEGSLPGYLYQWTDKGAEYLQELGRSAVYSIDWIPTDFAGQQEVGKGVEGRLDYLDVTFPKNKLRIPARQVRVSDVADVALIKVDLPTSVNKTELYDNYEEVAVGDPVTVLGYPGMSPDQVVLSDSQDYSNQNQVVRVVPDPTLSTGNIGKVIRSADQIADDTPGIQYVSRFGDMYQLTVNSTGPGNSGGPVFDSKGRVIAVFTAGTLDNTMTFAVPIRHALELMEVRKVIN